MKSYQQEIVDYTQSELFIPKDWWRLNNDENTSKVEFMAHPACEYTEYYYLLYLLKLLKTYSSKKRIKQNHLTSVLVHSQYDTQSPIQAFAIQKNQRIVNKESRNYKLDMGETTFILLDSPLAGTVCSALRLKGDSSVQAIRPLTYNQPWIRDIFIKERNTYVNPPKPYDLDLIKEAIMLIEKYGYIEAVIRTISQIGLPVNETIFIDNTKTNQFNLKNKKNRDLHGRLSRMYNL